MFGDVYKLCGKHCQSTKRTNNVFSWRRKRVKPITVRWHLRYSYINHRLGKNCFAQLSTFRGGLVAAGLAVRPTLSGFYHN